VQIHVLSPWRRGRQQITIHEQHFVLIGHAAGINRDPVAAPSVNGTAKIGYLCHEYVAEGEETIRHAQGNVGIGYGNGRPRAAIELIRGREVEVIRSGNRSKCQVPWGFTVETLVPTVEPTKLPKKHA